MMRLLQTCLLLRLFGGPSDAAELAAGAIFGDGMVLQREQPIPVWGFAIPGSEVLVSLADHRATAAADAGGRWSAILPALPASGPHRLELRSGSATAAVADIMIGDVWLISGQSNAVLALAATSEWPQVKTEGTIPLIRICKLPGTFAMEPADAFSRAIAWERLVPARAGYFSGVGYHFARTVQPAIGVALGLIQGSAGGTQVEQWTPEAELRAADPDSPAFAARDKAKARLAADPAAKVGASEAGAASLFNGTINPLRQTRLTGVVWYQGEANSRTKADYRPRLRTFIRSWRTVFGAPDLPFVIVQLPAFGLPVDDGWMRVQEAQLRTAEEFGQPLVVTIDQGSPTTIHPPNKAEVGRRAGLAALERVYRKPVVGTSPLPTTVRFADGAATVEYASDLVVRGDAIRGFELAGADGAFVAATARLDGRRVTVQAAGVPQPVALRYLWVHAPEAVTLYGPTGLPAPPFRFPDQTATSKP